MVAVGAVAGGDVWGVERWFFEISTVAQRRLGATSLAVISIFEAPTAGRRGAHWIQADIGKWDKPSSRGESDN